MSVLLTFLVTMDTKQYLLEIFTFSSRIKQVTLSYLTIPNLSKNLNQPKHLTSKRLTNSMYPS